MIFRLGVKVTLKDSAPFLDMPPYEIAPAFGEIYTVRDWRDDHWSGDAGILLVEIKNPPNSRGLESYFEAKAFRPVVERKTSIEIFRAMLNRQEIDA